MSELPIEAGQAPDPAIVFEIGLSIGALATAGKRLQALSDSKTLAESLSPEQSQELEDVARQVAGIIGRASRITEPTPETTIVDTPREEVLLGIQEAAEPEEPVVEPVPTVVPPSHTGDIITVGSQRIYTVPERPDSTKPPANPTEQLNDEGLPADYLRITSKIPELVAEDPSSAISIEIIDNNQININGKYIKLKGNTLLIFNTFIKNAGSKIKIGDLRDAGFVSAGQQPTPTGTISQALRSFRDKLDLDPENPLILAEGFTKSRVYWLSPNTVFSDNRTPPSDDTPTREDIHSNGNGNSTVLGLGEVASRVVSEAIRTASGVSLSVEREPIGHRDDEIIDVGPIIDEVLADAVEAITTRRPEALYDSSLANFQPVAPRANMADNEILDEIVPGDSIEAKIDFLTRLANNVEFQFAKNETENLRRLPPNLARCVVLLTRSQNALKAMDEMPSLAEPLNEQIQYTLVKYLKKIHPITSMIARETVHTESSLTFEDLVNEAYIGAIEAISRYDLSSSTAVSSFLAYRMRGSVRDAARDKGSLVKPSRLDLKRAGKDPKQATETEAARILAARERLERARVASPVVNPGSQDSEEVNHLELIASGEEVDSKVIGLLSEQEGRAQLQKVLRQIKPKARQAIELYFGINQPHQTSITMNKIAERLGVTESRVSQIVTRGLAQIRSIIEQDPELEALLVA